MTIKSGTCGYVPLEFTDQEMRSRLESILFKDALKQLRLDALNAKHRLNKRRQAFKANLKSHKAQENK